VAQQSPDLAANACSTGLLQVGVPPGVQPTVEAERLQLGSPEPGAPQFCILVVFESEEKARARERDPRRQEGLQVLRATLTDRLAGPPEFTDLAVVED
jgi:hypothetical protein